MQESYQLLTLSLSVSEHLKPLFLVRRLKLSTIEAIYSQYCFLALNKNIVFSKVLPAFHNTKHIHRRFQASD